MFFVNFCLFTDISFFFFFVGGGGGGGEGEKWDLNALVSDHCISFTLQKYFKRAYALSLWKSYCPECCQ